MDSDLGHLLSSVSWGTMETPDMKCYIHSTSLKRFRWPFHTPIETPVSDGVHNTSLQDTDQGLQVPDQGEDHSV